MSARAPTAGDVRHVFEHYRLYHPRSFPAPKSTGQEWRKIVSRLKEGYTVEDLCVAIDGYHRSPFHLGENKTGAKYLGLELVVRDGDHVAKGIEYATAVNAPVLSEREMKGARAIDSWARWREDRDAEK